MNALRTCRIKIRLKDHSHMISIFDKELMLYLTNIGEAHIIGIRRTVCLHLRKVERHIRNSPGISPTINKGLHSRCINTTVPTITRSLTPDGPTYRKRNNRSNFTVEKLGRPAPHSSNPGQFRTSGYLPS